jgi:hypothetical protein
MTTLTYNLSKMTALTYNLSKMTTLTYNLSKMTTLTYNLSKLTTHTYNLSKMTTLIYNLSRNHRQRTTENNCHIILLLCVMYCTIERICMINNTDQVICED